MKKIVFFVIWNIAWIALLFFVILEVGVRTRILPMSFQMWEITYQLDSDSLFRIKPFSHPSIGPYGNRVTGNPARSNAAHRILMLGDSFCYGVNVPPDQTIAADLERRLGDDSEVLNVSAPGFGPDQSLRQFQTRLQVWRPEGVVLTVFPANDFNDLYKNDLFQIDAAGHCAPNPDNALRRQLPRWQSAILLDAFRHKWLKTPARYTNLYKSFYYDHFDLDLLQNPDSAISLRKRALMRGVLEMFRTAVRQSGARFLVVLIPSFEGMVQTDFFTAKGIPADAHFRIENLAADICRQAQIDFIDLRDVLVPVERRAEYYDAKEHHLSALGYAATAGAIQRWLAQANGGPTTAAADRADP